MIWKYGLTDLSAIVTLKTVLVKPFAVPCYVQNQVLAITDRKKTIDQMKYSLISHINCMNASLIWNGGKNLHRFKRMVENVINAGLVCLLCMNVLWAQLIF